LEPSVPHLERGVVRRARGLLGLRGVRAGWVALVLSSCAACGLPLLDQPGYELGAVLALAHGLVGGLFALAAVRAEGRGPQASPARATAAAVLLLWAALVPPFALATVRTWATGPCDPFATALFFPVLTLPSALLSAAAGGVIGARLHRGWAQALAWAGVLLAAAAHALLPLVQGPQVFVLSHLFGYLPGPLYDEELHLPAALGWLRLGTLLLALALGAALARPARWRLAVGLAAAAGFLGLELAADRLGVRTSDASLGAHLAGERRSAEVVLRFAADTPPAEVDAALEDARFRASQVTRFLGGAQPGPVTVWWYPSAADKQRWVGASHTQFSKPWRREVHVNASAGPHPVLKHELVHALAAPFGAWPFGVTAGSLGVLPNLGLVEGLAVAADNPADELDLLHAAAAMKREGLLPDVRRLMTPSGFYGVAAARAYTTAGAFVRFLVERHGAAAVRALYARGDFEAAFHRGLGPLADDFEAALDEVPLDASLLGQARARFRRGSLFERPCAREVALLQEAAGSSEAGRALPLWRRCRMLQPREPAHALAEARALQALHRDDEAARLLDGLLDQLADDEPARGEAVLERGALAQRQGDPARARGLYEGLLAHQPSPPLARTAQVRLGSLAMTQAGAAAVTAYFEARSPARLELLRRAAPAGGWELAYLLGRALAQEGAGAEALEWLERSRADPGCPAAVQSEAHRLALEAGWRAGRCAWLEAQAQEAAPGSGLRARASDWAERCRFAHP
jgi:tetratricopeptide (TPR) repeat protein